jgi:hypothetical protein
MFLVVGYQAVCQRHGGDGDIGIGKRLALVAPLAEQIAGELRNFLSHRRRQTTKGDGLPHQSEL